MAGMSVSEVRENGTDAAGAPIRTVYAKRPPTYAVYGTAERVMVHYADDTGAQTAQRGILAGLNPVRGEINGLIDGWRASRHAQKVSAARRFDRRVADALVAAFENDAAGAKTLLDETKKDIVAERTSWARFLYLMAASATVASVVAILFILGSDWYRNPLPVPAEVWLAAGSGALGAFFSIAIAIHGRTILTDLRSRDNTADAVLRVLIGVIAAVLLYSLLRAGAVKLDLGGASLDSHRDFYVFIVGFLAGFSERLIPDLLAKTSLTAAQSPPAPPKTATDASSAQSSGGSASAPPSGGGASAVGDAENTTDTCLCDAPPTAAEATPDTELPPATGGVAPANA